MVTRGSSLESLVDETVALAIAVFSAYLLAFGVGVLVILWAEMSEKLMEYVITWLKEIGVEVVDE